MMNYEYLKASSALITYVNKFCYMLEVQLEGIKSTLQTTVTGVMAEIETINALTATSASKAEKSLEEAHFYPNKETKELFSKIQSIADQIVDSHSQDVGGESDALNLNILRFGGRYAKHMEALSRIDSSLQAPMSAMMGTLSVDDRTMQRIEHIILSLRALRISLEYILVDASRRLSPTHTNVLATDLINYSWQLYSMNDERKVYLKHFKIPEEVAEAKIVDGLVKTAG